MKDKIKRNVIVGQSGGPTAAINSSLAGVYRTAIDRGYNRVFGMLHGVQGLLEGRYIDLSEHIKTGLDQELLKRTPSAYLGSCRYKLPGINEDKAVYEKIFEILDDLQVDCFIYIGGNDSMDTIKKLSDYAIVTGSEIRFVGCPKTIDNDLALTDHTPGYGSAAKYIGTSVKEVIRDGWSLETAKGQILVMEIMGRNAGWLTAASALARGEDCDGPDLIYLPEVPFDLAAFRKKVDDLLDVKNNLMIAVSEGIHDADGTYICEYVSTEKLVDAFGHKQMGGTASYLCSYCEAEFGCKTRAIEFSTLQRCAAHFASQTDVNEAFQSGDKAVEAALSGRTGLMATLLRANDEPYVCEIGLADVHHISNVERLVPLEWITEDGSQISDDFIRYALPLIQGESQPVIENGLPKHLVLK